MPRSRWKRQMKETRHMKDIQTGHKSIPLPTPPLPNKSIKGGFQQSVLPFQRKGSKNILFVIV